MENTKKIRDWTLAFLLMICCLLTLWGIFGPVFDYFTGVKLVMLLVLGSLFGKIAQTDKAWIASLLQYGCAVVALLLGLHLLPPYFWPVRVYNLPLLGVFAITACLAWGYLLKELWSANLSWAYRTFCLLPAVLLISSFCAVRLLGGTLYAAGIYVIYNSILAIFFIIKSFKTGNLLYLNSGIFLLWAVVLAVLLTVYLDFPLLGYIACFGFSLLACNKWFLFYWQKKGRKK